MPKFGSDLPDLGDVFKSHPQPAVLKDLVAKYRTQALQHFQQTIPNKLLAIQQLIDSESDESSPMWAGHVDTPAYTQPTIRQPQAGEVMPSDVVTDPKATDENGPGRHWFEAVEQNAVQRQLIKTSIKEHEDLHMITQDLRVWLELEIPVIEDGNSFGADVQNSLIRELTDVYKRSNAFQNGCRAHYGDRLKYAQEWVKYPNLKDFPAAIAASDRFDNFLLRSYLRSLLMIYGGLLTKFERNWAKVINPKGSGSSSAMY